MLSKAVAKQRIRRMLVEKKDFWCERAEFFSNEKYLKKYPGLSDDSKDMCVYYNELIDALDDM